MTRVPLPQIFYSNKTFTRINNTIPLEHLYHNDNPYRSNPRQSQLTRETLFTDIFLLSHRLLHIVTTTDYTKDKFVAFNLSRVHRY
jgi:hypothetical protein